MSDYTYEPNQEENEEFIKEMDNIIRDIEQLDEISKNLQLSLKKQSPFIDSIEQNMTSTTDIITSSNNTLNDAQNLQQQSNIKKGIILTTGIFIMTFPISLVIGIKAGIAAGLVGLSSGASVWLMKSK